MNTLGQRIKSERKKGGWSQAVLAEELGVRIGTLSGYERGYRQPDIEMVAKMAEIFGVSTDYLLGRAEQHKPPGQYFAHEGQVYDLDRILESDILVTSGSEPLTELEKLEMRDYLRYLISKKFGNK